MDAKTRFLASAAHAYATTAPATAAHLQVCYNELFAADKAGTHTDSLKGVCPSCGSVLIPGLNSHMTVVDPRAKTPGHRSSSPAVRMSRKERNGSRPKTAMKLLRHECTRCGRYSETTLPKLEHTKPSVQHKENPLTVQVMGSHVTTALTGGDMRPRSRKKGGLKALLAEAKVTARPSPSLDLMDFMKST